MVTRARLLQERQEKMNWIISRKIDQGYTSVDAESITKHEIELFNEGLDGLYASEKRDEKNEHIRDKCLKQMRSKAFNRLTFFLSYPPVSADHVIELYRQELKIRELYGPYITSTLWNFYRSVKPQLSTNVNNLEKLFQDYLKQNQRARVNCW